MILKTKLFIYFFISFTVFCAAQMETYDYKRSLSTISEEWHRLTLPNAIFGKVNADFSDLRIYGITALDDTIAAPYFLKVLTEKVQRKSIPFRIINKTKSDSGYYFTFQLETNAAINKIDLNLSDQNFDWKVDLKGSQNQQEWFTILEDYRILSIKNTSTDYKFTTLNFPETKYQFYRLLVKEKTQPNLNSAVLFKNEVTEGNYITHAIKTIEMVNDKALKASIINVTLNAPVSISNLRLTVKNTFDYYRALKIEYKSDSIKTEKGWKYNYKTLKRRTLNSFEKNEFKFSSTIAKDLKITIYNADNQPLSIEGVSIKGYKHQLIARFTEPAEYSLVYGNALARIPNYDITKFQSNVPETMNPLTVGEEQVIVKPKKQSVKPLFENSYWLWGIIGLVILVLGGFTLRMLRKS